MPTSSLALTPVTFPAGLELVKIGIFSQRRPTSWRRFWSSSGLAMVGHHSHNLYPTNRSTFPPVFRPCVFLFSQPLPTRKFKFSSSSKLVMVGHGWYLFINKQEHFVHWFLDTLSLLFANQCQRADGKFLHLVGHGW